jgi:DNA-binding GntR family transcriptional regulator
MENNYAFHFLIYRARGQGVLTRMIETLWMRFGPLMRVVYGRVGTARLVDQHQQALDAIARGDAAGLAEAIRADIGDGRGLIDAEE